MRNIFFAKYHRLKKRADNELARWHLVLEKLTKELNLISLLVVFVMFRGLTCIQSL